MQFPHCHGHRLSPSVLSGGREPHILRITLHRKKPELLPWTRKGKILLGQALPRKPGIKRLSRTPWQ